MPTTVSDAASLINAVESAGPGSEIVARGGTYNLSGEWNITSSGNPGNPLVIRAAEGENPHIQFAAGLNSPTQDSGIKVDGSHVTVRGFEISDSGYKGIYASQADGCVFEDLNVHHCNVWGIMNNGSANVTFRNCDSHHNFDPQNEGQHSDGINMTGPARNGLIEGCRAWNNGDDGYDFWVSEDHVVRYCWSWNNGRGDQGNGNGFKLGSSENNAGGGHLVHNCVSFGNNVDNTSNSPGSGFWWNGEDDKRIEVYNCTAWGNGVNFAFRHTDHVLKNNISFQGPVDIGGPVIEEANTWNLGISDPGIRSTDPDDAGFARLEPGSPCIDAGVDVGLEYDGPAPDLGAYPFEGGDGGNGGNGDNGDGDEGRVSVGGETTIAAESVTRTNPQTTLDSNHNGFNGDGFLNFKPEGRSWGEWDLSVATGGEYDYEIRYANGKTGDRPTILSVGDQSQEVRFPPTGAWDAWDVRTGTVTLPAGDVTLRLEGTGGKIANVDYIHVAPSGGNGNGGSGGDGGGSGSNRARLGLLLGLGLGAAVVADRWHRD